MKKIGFLAIAGVISLSSCVSNPEGKKADTADQVELSDSVAGTAYTVDTAKSVVMWKGTKVTGFHEGTVKITSGSLAVDSNKVTGGNFVLDMNSISATDLEGENKDKLDGHLKNEDFFDVAKFPEAKFEITGVKDGATENEVVVSGNLTIKGITKNITFDGKVEENTSSTIKVVSDFNIEREDWGLNYSGSEDNLISKQINFKVTLVANNG